jgi:hypothetical protein
VLLGEDPAGLAQALRPPGGEHGQVDQPDREPDADHGADQADRVRQGADEVERLDADRGEEGGDEGGDAEQRDQPVQQRVEADARLAQVDTRQARFTTM